MAGSGTFGDLAVMTPNGRYVFVTYDRGRPPNKGGVVLVVGGKRGDFEPLISEDLFYQVQAILSGRVPSTSPRKRARPDFPLRAFVRCESFGRGLTGRWSKGRREYYAALAAARST